MISVIIPAYNEEKYLEDCLRAFEKQTFAKSNFEVIVVDNCSTDKTAIVARSLGAKVVSCGTLGVSHARQVGALAAKGEIIAGTDADTLVAQDWLEVIDKTFAKDSELVGITGSVEFLSQSSLNRFLAKNTFPNLIKALYFFGRTVLNGFNFAVKRTAFLEIGGFNTKLSSYEDIDLGLRLGKIGKMAYIEQMRVFTSGRRIDSSRTRFFWLNSQNFFRSLLHLKPVRFEAIR